MVMLGRRFNPEYDGDRGVETLLALPRFREARQCGETTLQVGEDAHVRGSRGAGDRCPYSLRLFSFASFQHWGVHKLWSGRDWRWEGVGGSHPRCKVGICIERTLVSSDLCNRHLAHELHGRRRGGSYEFAVGTREHQPQVSASNSTKGTGRITT